MLKKIKIANFMKSLAIMAVVAVIALEAPFAHRDYIRGIAEDNSVKIIGENGSGTGFHVRTKSGSVYILTNRHVCEMTGPLKVQKYGSLITVERKIIKKYEKHDLCVIEALPGVSGIKVGGKVENGEHVYTLGHPRGDALNVAEGEKFDDKEITLGEEVNEKGECNQGTLVEIPSFFGIFRICAVKKMTVQISSPTFPGNSGSAIVNKWGRLVSVVFAGSRDVESQGFGVPMTFIEDFLSSLK